MNQRGKKKKSILRNIQHKKAFLPLLCKQVSNRSQLLLSKLSSDIKKNVTIFFLTGESSETARSKLMTTASFGQTRATNLSLLSY